METIALFVGVLVVIEDSLGCLAIVGQASRGEVCGIGGTGYVLYLEVILTQMQSPMHKAT